MTRTILMVAALLSLSACGVKPGMVGPPAEAEKSGFPHKYPDLRTDPPPTPARQGF